MNKFILAAGNGLGVPLFWVPRHRQFWYWIINPREHAVDPRDYNLGAFGHPRNYSDIHDYIYTESLPLLHDNGNQEVLDSYVPLLNTRPEYPALVESRWTIRDYVNANGGIGAFIREGAISIGDPRHPCFSAR